MQHRIPILALGADGPRMAQAVSSCVHCGFCLPACPTYRVLGEEMDSPRGRIVLMKEALEGTLDVAEAAVHLDRCLGCLACETACPSGVRYRDLIEPFRATVVERRPWWQRARLAAMLRVMESPRLFRAGAQAAILARAVAPLLPRSLDAPLALLPSRLASPEALPATTPPTGARRGRVALMTGCVQAVLRPSITGAAVRVLAASGVEVVVPANQGCCGALAKHAGARSHGERLAAAHHASFPEDVDAILTTAAGCGSSMKDHATRAVPVLDVEDASEGKQTDKGQEEKFRRCSTTYTTEQLEPESPKILKNARPDFG
jgi:glycolate oxidase iron-sulfur subunit